MNKRTLSAKKNWFPWLCEHCLGSSGEGGSLIGMRRWWGNDAYVVRCHRHLFHLTKEDFDLVAKNI